MNRYINIILLSLLSLGVWAQDSAAVASAVPEIEYSMSARKTYEIAGIEVEGADSYEDFVLIGFSGLAVGDKIEVPGDQITKAIKRFWKQGLFSNVKIKAKKIEGNKIWLIIELEQRPRVSEVRYDGLKKSEREDVEIKAGIRQGSQMTPNLEDHAKTVIKKYLAEKGFHNSEIIDSIQTIGTEAVDATIGSITQVRECAARILEFAKTRNIPFIIIGHINKEGSLAGPKVLEHIVDTVLQFEGDQQYMYRILRAQKNRFGSTSEIGIYEMRQDGLREVTNPSELLLSTAREGLSGIAIGAAVEGVRPFLIEVQALVSSAAYGTPQRSSTGFDGRRLNMLLAVLEKRVGFKLLQKDVFLNIAGGLKVQDPAIDLAVLAAVLSSNMDIPLDAGTCLCGEVGLAGEIRSVNRIEQRIAEAQKLGFKRILIPAEHKIDTKRFQIEVVGVKKVTDAFRLLIKS